MKILKTLVHTAGQRYIKKVCLAESNRQVFSAHNERPIEYRFALETLAEHRPKTVLDVGSGTTAWPHLLRNCGYVVTAIDNVRDYWPQGMVNRHWTVLDVNIVNGDRALSAKYDAITCISVLEHIEAHAQAMQTMAGLLQSNGQLIMTTPFSYNNPHPNVYTHPDALYGKDVPYICRSSSSKELKEWSSCGLVLEKQELWKLFTGPVWATGQRCAWERANTENDPHQLGCFVFRKQ